VYGGNAVAVAAIVGIVTALPPGGPRASVPDIPFDSPVLVSKTASVVETAGYCRWRAQNLRALKDLSGFVERSRSRWTPGTPVSQYLGDAISDGNWRHVLRHSKYRIA